MPYRDPTEPPPDGEALAVQVLAARAARLRRRILLPAILFGLVSAVAGYLAVRELQFALVNGQIPWLSGIVGGLPPFGAALRVGQRIANGAVRARAPAWVDEQMELRGLPAGVLDEYLPVL